MARILSKRQAGLIGFFGNIFAFLEKNHDVPDYSTLKKFMIRNSLFPFIDFINDEDLEIIKLIDDLERYKLLKIVKSITNKDIVVLNQEVYQN